MTVRIFSTAAALFEELRFKQHMQGESGAQEAFRRSLNEAFASAFGMENIPRRLRRGLVVETSLAPPAVEIIEPVAKPVSCTPPDGADLNCGR